MALDTFPVIHTTRELIELYFQPQRIMTVLDRSGELAAGGYKLSDPFFTTDGNVSEYTELTDVPDVQLNDAFVELEPAQQPAIHFVADDIQVQKHLASVPGAIARYSDRRMRTSINDRLRATFEAIISGANATATGPLPAARNIELNQLTTAGTGNAHNKFGTEAGIEEWLDAVSTMKARHDALGWPEDGRYVVMHPELIKQARNYLWRDKPNLGVGVLVDRALVNGDNATMLFNYRVVTDPDIAPGENGSGSAAGDPVFQMHFGMMGDTQHFAAIIMRYEIERIQKQHASRYKSLVVHDSKVFDQERAGRIFFDLDAS